MLKRDAMMIDPKPMKLKDLVHIVSGFAFKSDLFTLNVNDKPLIRIRDVVRGTTNTFYSGEFSKEYLVKSGDILIGMDGEFNLAKWQEGEALLNQRVCKIQSSSDALLDDYLCYVLPRKLKEIEDKTPFVTVKHLSAKTIKEIEIPLPSLEDQRRIVRELDAAALLRQKRKQAIALLDDYLKSFFLEMFGDPLTNSKGWEKQSLEEVVIVQSGQVDPKSEPYAGMIHIGGADIESGTGKIINKVTAKEARQISGKYLFDENYLLYSKIRPNLNKVSLPDFKGICSADIYPIRPKENFRKGFLAFILKSKAFLEHAEINSGRANIPKINRRDLLKFQVIVPPTLEQEKFDTTWSKIDLIKQSMLAQSEQLDASFKALMQTAFLEK